MDLNVFVRVYREIVFNIRLLLPLLLFLSEFSFYDSNDSSHVISFYGIIKKKKGKKRRATIKNSLGWLSGGEVINKCTLCWKRCKKKTLKKSNAWWKERREARLKKTHTHPPYLILLAEADVIWKPLNFKVKKKFRLSTKLFARI